MLLKLTIAVICFLALTTWYVFCWLCRKNEKFEKTTFVLTIMLAVLSILACIMV